MIKDCSTCKYKKPGCLDKVGPCQSFDKWKAQDGIGEEKPIEPIMQFFNYDHLPDELARISKPFASLAESLICNLPRNPERTVALRKLLEAKDCAVRAYIYQETDK